MRDMSLGEKLRQAREEKKLTLKQVVDDTNITLRHIEALEDDNYSIFPGKTYILGFIRNYATYLGFDPDELIQLYKNDMLMKSEMPLEELTKPTVTSLDRILYYLKFSVIPIAAMLLVLVIYKLFMSSSLPTREAKNSSYNGYNIEQIAIDAGKIPTQKTESVQVHDSVFNTLITLGQGIDFPVNNKEVYFILNEIKYKNLENELSQAVLIVYPGKISVLLNENKTSNVSIPDIQKTLSIDLVGTTPNNIKINVRIPKDGESIAVVTPPVTTQEVLTTPAITPKNTPTPQTVDVTSNLNNNQNEVAISLDVKTLRQNYVEFYVDGQQKKKGLMQPNESIHLMATDSIQMKIGDAGVIELLLNGKPIKTGRKGQQINRVIRKVRDPIEQNKFKIEVKDS